MRKPADGSRSAALYEPFFRESTFLYRRDISETTLSFNRLDCGTIELEFLSSCGSTTILWYRHHISALEIVSFQNEYIPWPDVWVARCHSNLLGRNMYSDRVLSNISLSLSSMTPTECEGDGRTSFTFHFSALAGEKSFVVVFYPPAKKAK